MKTKKELNELKKEVKALQGKLASLSEEELEEVVGGGEAGNATFLCEYESNILLYRTSSNAYLLLDTLTGNERTVENAKDLDDAACELKKLR